MADLQKESFSFNNLEPINYLKTFNKLRDHMIKNQPSTYRKGQLKVVNLSKFPLPAYYSEMEGIFQSANRKNTENNKNRQKLFQQRQEEQFIMKHKLFVKKTLQKIIQDNSKQQLNFIRTKEQFLKSKKIPQAQTLKLVKARSQPKLGKINFNMTNSTTHSIKNKQMTSSNLSLRRKISLLQNKNHQKNEQNNQISQQSQKAPSQQIYKHNRIFKEILPPKKRQKFHKRHFQQIEDFLTTRKTFKNNQHSKMTAPPTLMALTQRNYKSLHTNQYNTKIKFSQSKNENIDENVQQKDQYEQTDQDFIQQLFHTTRSIPKNSENIMQRLIQDLQIQQSIAQGQFGSKLDNKINLFKKKLQQQVQNIKALKY